MRLSVKLAIICSTAVAIPLLAASIFLANQITSRFTEKSIQRLKSQNKAAMSIYDKRLSEIQLAAAGLADDIGGRLLLGVDGQISGDQQARAKLQDLLSTERDALALDFIIVADSAGRVLARQNDTPGPGELVTSPAKPNRMIDSLLSSGTRLQPASVAGCAVEQPEFLSRMWLDKAAKVDGSQVNQALVMEAGAPIMSSGRFLGIVFAGQMLNNYYVAKPGAGDLQTPLVTAIRRNLFSESDDSGSLVALGNSVIASSVFRSGAAEPVFRGAKCDPSKDVDTLNDGDLQFAVSWEPILSAEGSDIGAVGVAVPSDRLNDGSVTMLLLAVGAALTGAVIAGLAGLVFGEMLASRLRALTDAVRRMSVGELSTEVRDRPQLKRQNGLLGKLSKAVHFGSNEGSNGNTRHRNSLMNSSDEIGVLTEHLEQMRASFRMAIERIRKR